MRDRRFTVGLGLVLALHLIGAAWCLTCLLDADHLLGIKQVCGEINIWTILTCQSGRPLHLPAVVISFLVWCVACALFAGLLLASVALDRRHAVAGDVKPTVGDEEGG